MSTSRLEKAAARWALRQVADGIIRSTLSGGLPTVPRLVYRALKPSAVNLPARRIDEIFPFLRDVEVCIRHGGEDGGISFAEMVVLCKLVRGFDMKAVFEIGTFRGTTTLAVARNVSPSCRIFTLDLPAVGEERAALELSDLELIRKSASGERFRGEPESSLITQLYGDSATFDYLPYFGKMDLVLVDASHTYAYVTSDSRMARSLLKPNGMILWHDYPTYPGVWRAVEEAVATWTGGSPWYIAGTSFVVWINEGDGRGHAPQ